MNKNDFTDIVATLTTNLELRDLKVDIGYWARPTYLSAEMMRPFDRLDTMDFCQERWKKIIRRHL